MQQFIGTKLVTANPMSYNDFCEAQGKELPELAKGEERTDKEGYEVTYPDGYVSWSPKEAFDEAYVAVPVDQDADAVLRDVRRNTLHLLGYPA